ncbi:hypothetical protein BS50DRAFT_567084 [Corynespora cassiicola Philippines]|uniref:ribonuclease Z n=1 Tax=Corynespora cassiicola Philippines TaxID=1448308 RepID=A0A2T2PA30_CORCC|nr:hypothetical protein BS50DRAFT_567084 [Corynespora cassiicola Philippines]
MTSLFQFITVPTADTRGTALVLQTGKQNYVFGNQSEGTQRALTQVGGRLTKVQNFFLTGRTQWANTGGLVGMILTLADSQITAYETSFDVWRKKAKANGKPEPARPAVHLHGPPNLKHSLGTCRRFIFRKGVPLTATEYRDVPPEKDEHGDLPPSWQDENIRVWALSVSPTAVGADHGVDDDLDSEKFRYDTKLNNFEEFRLPEGGESKEDMESRYDRIRTAVVNYMFNSTWKFDTLVERHISEVEMPTALFVRPPGSHRFEPYKGPMPGGSQPLPDITVWTRTPWPGAKVLALPPTRPAPEAVSYIVRTHSARGKFDVKRAVALGVPKGPDFARLTRGENVTLSSGEIITPDMVMGPDRPGQGIAILDVPALAYFESLIQREELKSEKIMEGIGAIVWILGPGLSSDSAVHQFIQKMDKVQHIISSVDVCPNRLTFDSVAAQTIRLAQIDSDRYPYLFHDNTSLPQNSLYGCELPHGTPPPSAIVADRCLEINVMPNFSINQARIPSLLDPPSIQNETSKSVIELAELAKEEVRRDKEALQAWKQLVARPDTEVITLGTGSSVPSKYRNVSATLVRVPGIGNYLFDCGEGTLGQLQRVFQPDELIEVIKNLRMIWISHLHADHHLGTASLLQTWYSLVHNSVPAENPPRAQSLAANASSYGLSVISHQGMLQWLREYSSVEDFGYSRILPLEISPVGRDAWAGSGLTLSSAQGQELPVEDCVLDPKDYEAILGLTDIQACRVSHCHGAMAVSLTFPPSPLDPEPDKPLKISYSGDCRPSPSFVNIGLHSTVLIHEATFDDELQGDAKAKKHSTTSEALGIGARMKAKAVVLTHFSQRYQRVPILQTVEDHEQGNDTDMADVVAEEAEVDDGEDAPADNMDVHAPSASLAPPAVASDTAQADASNDLVIKVRAKDMKVAIAFDYMRTKIGEIAELEKYSRALNKLLVTEDEEAPAEAEGFINANGKKASGDEQGDERAAKKKKSKRNN